MTGDHSNHIQHSGKITRRGSLKLIVLLGSASLLLPATRLAQFLYPPTSTLPISYPRMRISNTKDLSTGQSLLFEYPHPGRPAILIHLSDGFTAFDSICTHLGCQVHFDGVTVAGYENNPQNFCPCHGGVFDSNTGKVLGGPPPRPLPKIKLEIDDQGEIFANGYESGLPLYGVA